MSEGAKQLLEIVRKIYPNQRIIKEHHIGERLRLDIYVPSLRMGFEYDGRQHYEFVPHFHGSIEGFAEAKKRDARKIELCDQQAITLISVAYNEPMTTECVRDKINEAFDG